MKHNTILAIIVVALIILALSIPCNAQPKNLQCKVVEVLGRGRRSIELKTISMRGDTVYIKYYSRKPISNIVLGTWLTVYADESDKKCVWNSRKIKVNN